jgi:hypothetical protein
VKRTTIGILLTTLVLTATFPRLLAEGGDPLWQPSVRIPIEEHPAPSPSTPPPPANPEPSSPNNPQEQQTLTHRERAELLVQEQRIEAARDEYRKALQETPDNDALREQFAWFLYSNGFHDQECLQLLKTSLATGKPENPTGLFNAIVEVSDELGVIAPPAPESRQTAPADTRQHGITVVPQKKVRESKSVTPEVVERVRRWTFTPYYDYSFFNKGRQGWQEEYAQMLYRVNNRLTVGGEVDILERPPSGTNTYYSGLASYYLWKFLEVHGRISICPAPTFAATQIYSGGLIYQAAPRLGLLFDYQHYNFFQGPIDQLNPGIVWNFTDESSLAVRYTRGWAYSTLEYNYYSAALNLGLPGRRKLTMAFAYGTDPDSEIGANNSNVASLSPAYTYSLFLSQPLTRDLTLLAGVQYVYRLKESGGELYQQLTPTLGCSLKF